MESDTVNNAVMRNDIGYIKRELVTINTKLDSNYVPRSEFIPVRNLVYGLVGLILTAFIGALATLVLKQ